jgi:hypothetical protein
MHAGHRCFRAEHACCTSGSAGLVLASLPSWHCVAAGGNPLLPGRAIASAFARIASTLRRRINLIVSDRFGDLYLIVARLLSLSSGRGGCLGESTAHRQIYQIQRLYGRLSLRDRGARRLVLLSSSTSCPGWPSPTVWRHDDP